MFLSGLVGFWVVERQGQRRVPAAGRARIATRRAGWLPFAGPSGWPSDSLELGSIGIDGLLVNIARMNHVAPRPVRRLLVINDHIGLRQERREAVTKPELLCARSGIVSPTCTPAVKNRSLRMQIKNMPDDGWDRYAFGSHTAHNGVVDVHVHMDG